MFLTDLVSEITLGQAGLYALLGYAMVFFGLILLMIVVTLVGKYFVALTRQQKAHAEASAPQETPAPATAPGAAGQLKLHNVEPRTAAMLMAITAEKLGKPINELRFISIKEVTQ